ncbi:MAG: lytic transglycosylase [Piscirickettsiaceae bacterium]|nr:MAG: lytic transglycosylase [Piscirickettsiaceae bacterium]
MVLKQTFFLNYVLAFLLLGFFSGPDVYADLYKKVDRYGNTFYTDKPDSTGYRLIIRTPKKGSIEYKNFEANRHKHAPVIRKQARKYRVDPALVMAVVHTESAYDRKAVSKAGAVGLMQLMPKTAQRFGVTDRRNAEQNINGGTRYLRYLLELYKFDIRLALAAYNAGEGAVLKYGNKVPPYAETQAYVKTVISRYQDYMKTSASL